jgi:AT hook motif
LVSFRHLTLSSLQTHFGILFTPVSGSQLRHRSTSANIIKIIEQEMEVPATKRPRGRPRKHPVATMPSDNTEPQGQALPSTIPASVATINATTQSSHTLMPDSIPQQHSDGQLNAPAPRPSGKPEGSKNNPVDPDLVVPRKRGRPKGSKDKTPASERKRPRGRPRKYPRLDNGAASSPGPVRANDAHGQAAAVPSDDEPEPTVSNALSSAFRLIDPSGSDADNENELTRENESAFDLADGSHKRQKQRSNADHLHQRDIPNRPDTTPQLQNPDRAKPKRKSRASAANGLASVAAPASAKGSEVDENTRSGPSQTFYLGQPPSGQVHISFYDHAPLTAGIRSTTVTDSGRQTGLTISGTLRLTFHEGQRKDGPNSEYFIEPGGVRSFYFTGAMIPSDRLLTDQAASVTLPGMALPEAGM